MAVSIHLFKQCLLTAFHGIGPAKHCQSMGQRYWSSRSYSGEGGLGAMETHLLSQNILVDPTVSLWPSSVLQRACPCSQVCISFQRSPWVPPFVFSLSELVRGKGASEGEHASGAASEHPTWSHNLPFLTTGIWTLSCPLYCSPLIWGFPYGSSGEESVCSAGDSGLIPGLERSPGEGTSNSL